MENGYAHVAAHVHGNQSLKPEGLSLPTPLLWPRVHPMTKTVDTIKGSGMLLTVEHQYPLAPEERTDDMNKSLLLPTRGYSDQPQGEVCPPVQTGGGALMKTCPQCKMPKLFTAEFFRRDISTRTGLGNTCRDCCRSASRISKQAKYDLNPESFRKASARYRKQYPAKVKLYDEQYRHSHKEEKNATGRKWYKFNKDKKNAYSKRWRVSNCRRAIAYRTGNNMRVRLNDALRGRQKYASTMTLIGCSLNKLKEYIESQFVAGMSWSNRNEWHIDHIVPLCSFNLSMKDQQKTAFHYTNLRPMWAMDNMKKGGKMTNFQKQVVGNLIQRKE
jgi:hypothetical protein